MDFFGPLPPDMLLNVVRQRQRDIRDQVWGARRPAVTALKREKANALRAVGHLRRLITATGGTGR
jgi:hypothetical protein